MELEEIKHLFETIEDIDTKKFHLEKKLKYSLLVLSIPDTEHKQTIIINTYHNLRITLSKAIFFMKKHKLSKDISASNFMIQLENINNKLLKQKYTDEQLDEIKKYQEQLSNLGYLNILSSDNRLCLDFHEPIYHYIDRNPKFVYFEYFSETVVKNKKYENIIFDHNLIATKIGFNSAVDIIKRLIKLSKEELVLYDEIFNELRIFYPGLNYTTFKSKTSDAYPDVLSLSNLYKEKLCEYISDKITQYRLNIIF